MTTIRDVIPEHLLRQAENTLPEGTELNDWILQWTEFGLNAAELASSRREAIEIQATLAAVAHSKYSELIDYVKDNLGVGEDQLFEEVGTQLSNFESRMSEIETITNVSDRNSAFGELFNQLQAFVDPTNTQSAIYRYNQMLLNIDDEDGLIRQAIAKELGKQGGILSILNTLNQQLSERRQRAEVIRGTPLKGDTFEESLLLNLRNLIGGQSVQFTNVGQLTGHTPRSFKGDIELTFTEEHVLAGKKIVYEAKDEDGWYIDGPNPDTSATNYLTLAQTNRAAEIGVFVLSREQWVEGRWPRELTVLGNQIFVVWDQDDPRTDWLITAATFIAIGRMKAVEDQIDPNQREAIASVTGRLEVEVERYGRMRGHIDRIQSNADNLSDQLRIGEGAIERCIREANNTLRILNMEGVELTDIEFDFVDIESGAIIEDIVGGDIEPDNDDE